MTAGLCFVLERLLCNAWRLQLNRRTFLKERYIALLTQLSLQTRAELKMSQLHVCVRGAETYICNISCAREGGYHLKQHTESKAI